MRHVLLSESGVERAHMLVLDKGDEVLAQLRDFAREQDVHAGRFHGIGAFERATLAFYERASRSYREIPVDEQVEVLSIVGSIGVHDGNPRVHAHAVLGRSDGSTLGGHLVAGTAWPTLEVSLVVTAGELRARLDDETGLPLLVP